MKSNALTGVDINYLDVSPFGVKRFKKAVSQFEIILQPIDEKMASLLKPKLNNHLRNPRQVSFNCTLRFCTYINFYNVYGECLNFECFFLAVR